MSIESLTAAQCTLLTVHYATEGNIPSLHSFTPSRLDVLPSELVLKVLLTFLPETIDPKTYTTYIGEVASQLYIDVSTQELVVDTSPVKDIDDSQARKKVNKLQLLEIKPPKFPPHAPDDLLTRFLCHRSYRIDSETGVLSLVPSLVEPFLERNDFTRVWYISVVLPLLRLNYEYYPQQDTYTSLEDFEKMEGKEGIDYLLSATLRRYDAGADQTDSEENLICRDMKGLVGPWMYGHTDRKRRRVEKERDDGAVEELSTRVRKISLSGVSEADKTGHDWEYVYKWMVDQAQTRFPLVTQLIEDWDGPSDIDCGEFAKGHRFYLHSSIQTKLESQYAQAAFASCYAAQADTEATIRGAHGILARLAELLEFIPPPDLATSVDSLPKVERHATRLEESSTLRDIEVGALLQPEHPLTTPSMETYMLLQMMVYSAYQFSGLGYKLAIINVAKLHFYSSSDELLQILQRILDGLIKSGRRDKAQWAQDRAKLIWLWNWGIDTEDTTTSEGAGVLGRIKKTDFEREMLRAFVDTSCYDLTSETIQHDIQHGLLTSAEAEDVVVAKALEAYDGASNGNRTRGGIKKANDIITAMRPQFPRSTKFTQLSALISATHSLSFYALTLQHGVPFQPVSIRVSRDPLDLINKVLEQNPHSYAKLDDLVGIARNLASAGLGTEENDTDDKSKATGAVTDEQSKRNAERRVTFMAVEAALREDDFETAYSYIISRLTPSTSEISAPPLSTSHIRSTSASSTLSSAQLIDDDTSWRAAYLAGRYRPATSSSPTLRRLEQRIELLSLALLLAPASALTDILSAWRRCEEETSALYAAQQQEEQAFDDHADRREPSALPGNFTVSDEQPQMILNQKRREMGRMAATSKGESEAPMSMFDLTRNAARAFSRNVNIGQTSRPSLEGSARPGSPDGPEGEHRVRRRDMVANAVSGGLASGIGWVLGAKPVDQ